MFSIIIPLYNKTFYIEKCLQSVLNQTFQDFEVIVVNDGSTDNGSEKVEGFKVQIEDPDQSVRSSKFKVISQVNSGVSIARNNGVKAAKYNHIAFLDADDWWDSHFLEEMKGLIENYPNAGFYGCNYYYVKNGIKRIEEKGIPYDFKSGYIDYIKTYGSSFCVPINCSFVVITKTVFIKFGGFNPSLKFGEDFDLWIRLTQNYKVAYLNKTLAYSNQDVSVNQRAVGNNKLYQPQNHFIFNLGYLDENEKTNSDLKILLDGLRVRSLQQYYLAGMYPAEVKPLLKKVDFSKQPLYYRFFYKSPKSLVNLFFYFRFLGSKFKQYILRKIK